MRRKPTQAGEVVNVTTHTDFGTQRHVHYLPPLAVSPARNAHHGPAGFSFRGHWATADRTLDLVRAAGDADARVAVHGMRLPLGMLLVIWAFELWI